VNLSIGRALLLGAFHIARGHLLSALLHFSRDGQQRFQLARDAGTLGIDFCLFHQVIVSIPMGGCGRAVRKLAEIAFVAIRDVRGDHFAFRGSERIGSAVESFR